MHRFVWGGTLALLGCGLALADDFEAPVRLNAGERAIDTDTGHAAPYYHDLDGDGDRDLLVGQFGEGKLRIYRNQGSDAEPRFGEVEWFQAGGEVGKIPSG